MFRKHNVLSGKKQKGKTLSLLSYEDCIKQKKDKTNCQLISVKELLKREEQYLNLVDSLVMCFSIFIILFFLL